MMQHAFIIDHDNQTKRWSLYAGYKVKGGLFSKSLSHLLKSPPKRVQNNYLSTFSSISDVDYVGGILSLINVYTFIQWGVTSLESQMVQPSTCWVPGFYTCLSSRFA